jgi:hypothetical protein
MKQIYRVGLLLVLVFLFLGAGLAGATSYDFSFNGANISGTGTIEATDNGDGTSTVISGFTTVDSWGTFSLITNPNAPNFSDSPYNFGDVPGYPAFRYDDVLYPSGSITGYLDNYGLLFENSTNQWELNIWGNSNAPYSAYIYHKGDWELADGSWYVSHNDDVVFSMELNPAPVPEPATLLLFGSGLFGIAGFRKRFFKR